MGLDLAAALLELDPEPLLVVDAGARIVHRNAAAAALLAGEAALVDDAGVLRGRHPADSQTIAARTLALARLHRLAIADPFSLPLQGSRTLRLTFKRLDTPERLVLVRVQETGAQIADRCAEFARSHGLSAPELRLLRAVVEGETVTDYCARTGLKLLTERSRLQALYRLTGARRQSTLIIAVLSGVKGAAGPHRPSRLGSPEPKAAVAADARGASAPEGATPDAHRRSPLAPGERRPALPSAADIKALDAFVRRGSMKAAARALGTYPGNISRHIRKLEQTTGLRLTQGSRPDVRPSAEGLVLAAAAARAFLILEDAAPGALSLEETDASDDRAPDGAGARARLPSFTGVKALEAFVRLGSLSAAALELRSHPTNIGRQIRQLGSAAALSLIEGARTATRPTPDGVRLAAAAAEAFDHIHAAAPAVKRRPRPPSDADGARSRAFRDSRT